MAPRGLWGFVVAAVVAALPVSGLAIASGRSTHAAERALGRKVLGQSGCLACHRLGDQGNSGPGRRLDGVGERLSRAALTAELRSPRAPMPSYRGLPARDFRALVSYLAGLRLASRPPAGPFSVAVSARTLRYPRPNHVTYRVHLASRDGQPIGVLPEAPGWPDHAVTGTTTSWSRPRLDGPGRLTEFASGGTVPSPTACFRGNPNDGGGLVVHLRARQSTTLVLDAALSAPPWPGARYGLRFTITEPFAGTTGRAYSPRSTGVRVLGPSGVHITLGVRGPLPADSSGALRLRHPRSLLLTGRTSPVVAGQRIELSFTRPPAGRGRLIARARTDRRGRFATRWTPRRGLFVVGATYRHPRAGLVADTACDLAVHVGR